MDLVTIGNESVLLSSLQDITTWKQAELALVESDNKLRTFMKEAPIGFMLFDSNFNFIDINDVALRWFPPGTVKEEILGKKAEDIVPNLKETGRFDRYVNVIKTGEPYFIEDLVPHPKFGNKIFEIRTFKAGEGLGQIVTDITEKKGNEERLKEYSEHLEEMVEHRTKELLDIQEKLVRTEKLAILGQLAGGIGHELRNPLGTIKNAVFYLNMVLEKPDNEVKESLQIINEEVETSENLISGLLDYARPKPLNLQKSNIFEIIQKAISKVTIPKTIQIKNKVSTINSAVAADPEQLSHVFRNLILNAIQAMQDGGELILTHKTQNPDSIIISVTDTGKGISNENMKHIFEPLFTTKTKGIGLGLAISKTIIENHKGTINVFSDFGKGTTFIIKLPRYQQSEGI